MSLQSNTQGTVTSSNNWRCFVTDFSKDIFELEMLGGDFVRGECFCSVFQFSSEIATMLCVLRGSPLLRLEMELRWSATDSQLIYADGSFFCGA